MNTDTQTITPVREIHGSGVANLVPINGGREVSIFEKVAVTLMTRPDMNMEQLQQIMQMHERFEERQSEKAFIQAMSEFKRNPPKIVKDKTVGYTNRDGEFVGYSHASLAAVCDAAIAGLATVGISHRWDVEQQGNQVTVICVLTHAAGHSTRTPITAPTDTSGKKNAIQSIASSISYLERYTLLAATGLATEEQDDDGASHGDEFPKWVYEVVETIDKAQDQATTRACRNAAAQRCRAEQQQRAWNEVINPAYQKKCEQNGWPMNKKES